MPEKKIAKNCGIGNAILPLQPAKMKDFPLLYTARLKLRKIQVEDIPSLVNHANNKNISNHILNMPFCF
jgi:hypothetical protein